MRSRASMRSTRCKLYILRAMPNASGPRYLSRGLFGRPLCVLGGRRPVRLHTAQSTCECLEMKFMRYGNHARAKGPGPMLLDRRVPRSGEQMPGKTA